MEITCTSDLHGHYPKLEGGDLLIVAGDCLANDTLQARIDFFVWLQRQKYKERIYIAGNHDNIFEKRSPTDAPEGIYLCDSGTEFEGIRIWGSPWTLRFEGMNPNCMAFTCETEEELAEKWALIPHDTDILVTHSPPKYGLDKTIWQDNVGSASLTDWVMDHQPKLHVFGHIHESYGKITDATVRELSMELFGNASNRLSNTTIVNASHVNERYEPVNKPIRIELEVTRNEL